MSSDSVSFHTPAMYRKNIIGHENQVEEKIWRHETAGKKTWLTKSKPPDQSKHNSEEIEYNQIPTNQKS